MKRYAGATKKGEKFKRTALFFKEDDLEKLQRLSAETGAPVAELVRRSVHSMLETRRDEWDKGQQSEHSKKQK